MYYIKEQTQPESHDDSRFWYNRSNSTKTPASRADNVTQPRLTPQVRRVREAVCALISVFLQSERWRCQYPSAYVAAAIT
jgi:hypothetical protein